MPLYHMLHFVTVAVDLTLLREDTARNWRFPFCMVKANVLSGWHHEYSYLDIFSSWCSKS